MAALPPTRRIVTGHSPTGRAIFESDTLLYPIDPRAPPPSADTAAAETKSKGGFTLVYRTEGTPAKTQGPWTDYHGKTLPLTEPGSTILRQVDMLPHASSPMHRTSSLDVGIVLIGEVVLELDDGVERVMRVGDTCVQRGTAHRWHNRTDEVARVAFVLVPGEAIVVGGKVLEPYFGKAPEGEGPS